MNYLIVPAVLSCLASAENNNTTASQNATQPIVLPTPSLEETLEREVKNHIV